MHKLAVWVSVLTCFVLSGCQTAYHTEPNGESRHLISWEYGGPPIEVFGQMLEQAVQKCWIGNVSGFRGLKASPLSKLTNGEKMGFKVSQPERAFQIALTDPTHRKRYAYINMFPPSKSDDFGHVVQVVQRGEGVGVATVIDDALSRFDHGERLCESQ